MRNILYSFIILIICTVSGFSLYSCNCSCYDTENMIKVDTVRQKINVSDSGPFYVQIGAFLNKDNADNFAIVARSKLSAAVIVRMFSDGIYRIIAGDEFNDIKSAESFLTTVQSSGYPDAIIRDAAGPVKKN